MEPGECHPKVTLAFSDFRDFVFAICFRYFYLATFFATFFSRFFFFANLFLRDFYLRDFFSLRLRSQRGFLTRPTQTPLCELLLRRVSL